jgi:hypothetical protein
MEHSELGRRWVYDGTTDPVALDSFRRAILGEQHQALFEMWEEGRLVGTKESTVHLSTTPGTSVEGGSVHIARDLDHGGATPGPALVATWAGGEAVVASLGD